jgi:hypothetical protein
MRNGELWPVADLVKRDPGKIPRNQMFPRTREISQKCSVSNIFSDNEKD